MYPNPRKKTINAYTSSSKKNQEIIEQCYKTLKLEYPHSGNLAHVHNSPVNKEVRSVCDKL